MAVFRVQADYENYMSFELDMEEIISKLGEDFDFGFPSKGVPVKDSWQELTGCRFVQPEEFPGATKVPDITEWQAGDLVLSEKAYQVLESRVRDYGEFLPVKCQGRQFYVFNILAMPESVVDTEKSERDIDQGILMGIRKMVFREEMLENVLLFKTRYDGMTTVYGTGAFKEIIETAGLSGLLFSAV